MNKHAGIFLCSIILLFIMLFLSPTNLKNGFFYYLLIFILSINIISIFFIFILKDIDDKLILFFSKIKNGIVFIIKIKNKMSFIKTTMTIIIIATIGWLSFVWDLISKQNDEFDLFCLLNIKEEGLSLNEWGDFLAGFIAPLALIWLAYSIYYQKKEFENVHSSLQDQVAELEIEKHYNNYEQHVSKIDLLINSVNIEMGTLSFDELNKSFTLINPHEYLNVATKIKKIFLLNKSLLVILQNHKKHEKSKLALKELTQQYDMIYLEDMNIMYEMILKYYFLIAISKKEIKHELIYKNFSKLDFWIDEDKKERIIEIINKIEGETLFDKKVDPAFLTIKNYKELLD